MRVVFTLLFKKNLKSDLWPVMVRLIDLISLPIFRDAGLDIIEQTLESSDDAQHFKSCATFIARRAHFDNEIALILSCEEIAAASILVTCDLLGDFTRLENLPSSLLTDRAVEGAVALRQLIGSRESSADFPIRGAPSAQIMVEK